MGRPRSNSIPAMRKCSKGRFARVVLNGVEHRLGLWGSNEAAEKYDLLIKTWLANGREIGTARAVEIGSVEDLSEHYLDWCDRTYRKNGRLTSTYYINQRALSLLYNSGLSSVMRDEFGPKHLSEFRAWLAIKGVTYISGRHTESGKPTAGKLTRKTINQYVQAVVAMFKWAVSEELVPESVFMALKTLPATRRRRPIPGTSVVVRESTPVPPVPADVIDRTCKHLSATVAAMVRLQLITGMRPAEVCGIRGKYLRKTNTPDVMAYEVPHSHNKTDHIDVDRTVFLGPKAMKILTPLLPDDPEEFVFNPRKVRAAMDAKRRAERKVPMWPSHDPELRRARRNQKRGREGRTPGECYSSRSYAKAITAACRDAGLKPQEFWSPNQLRHNAATEFANSAKIEVAQLLLGHRDIKTTMRYVQVLDRRAEEAAKRLA